MQPGNRAFAFIIVTLVVNAYGYWSDLAGYADLLTGKQGGLIKYLPARLGERGAIVYGIVINGLVFVFLSPVWNGWVAFAFTTVTALGAVVNPVLQARMNRIAQDNQQGELQGVVSSVRLLAAIFSPLC